MRCSRRSSPGRRTACPTSPRPGCSPRRATGSIDQRAPRAGARGARRDRCALSLAEAREVEEPDAFPRRAAEAALRVRAPGDRPGGAHAADAADRARPRRGADRARVPRVAGDDGPAAGAREGARSARRASRSRCRTPHELPARLEGGARGDLRRLRHRLGRRGAAPTPRRRDLAERGDLARARRWPADARRARGPRAAGADAALRGAAAGAARRRTARYVPLSEQDPARWSRATIDEAERELAAAARARRSGRFQLEAAIQSVHAERRVTGRATDWDAIAAFYDALLQARADARRRVGARGGRWPRRAGRRRGSRGSTSSTPTSVRRLPAVLGGARPPAAAPGPRRCGAHGATSARIGLCDDDAVRQYLIARRG